MWLCFVSVKTDPSCAKGSSFKIIVFNYIANDDFKYASFEILLSRIETDENL